MRRDEAAPQAGASAEIMGEALLYVSFLGVCRVSCQEMLQFREAIFPKHSIHSSMIRTTVDLILSACSFARHVFRVFLKSSDG